MDSLEKELKEMSNCDNLLIDNQANKKQQIESFVGSNALEINVLNPNKASYKGSGTGKRKKSEKEIATENSKKNLRVCRTCGKKARHDSRNCPAKFTIEGDNDSPSDTE